MAPTTSLAHRTFYRSSIHELHERSTKDSCATTDLSAQHLHQMISPRSWWWLSLGNIPVSALNRKLFPDHFDARIGGFQAFRGGSPEPHHSSLNALPKRVELPRCRQQAQNGNCLHNHQGDISVRGCQDAGWKLHTTLYRDGSRASSLMQTT